MIVDKKRRKNTKVSRKALVVMFFIVCLSLLIISGMEPVCFADARTVSNEGWIVFRRVTVAMRNCIFIMDANGKNERQLTTGHHLSPRWSPNGKQIVFRGSGKQGIYIIDADGSNMIQLTNGQDDCPAWSSDGKQITFVRNTWENNGDVLELKSSDVYTMDPDGANLNKITENLEQISYLDWSPDGEKIAFETYKAKRSFHIWVMNSDGSDKKRINTWGYCPDWSLDGREIIFASEQGNLWGSGDIYVMDADGSNVKRIIGPDLPNDWSPIWSPDGEKIAFTSNRDGANNDIYIMSKNGQDIQRITNTPDIECELDWTAFSYAVEPFGKLTGNWGMIKAE